MTIVNETTTKTIPAELANLSQWVTWRYEKRGDKTTKAPIDAKSNGKLTYAKSNDPATWAPLETALSACGCHSELAGIGFCFSPNDGLTGLDLDHVIDPATGELDPDAASILERFKGTYAEVSPSGTGFRVFCYGKPQRSGKNVGKVKWLEVYSYPSNRYLTVTGNHWDGTATNITDQQAALDWLHERYMKSTEVEPQQKPVDAKPNTINLDDAQLLAEARSAKNGGEFDRLWSGDKSGHGGDHSGADQALCNLLAFWTRKDAARIDRLFRQSGLMREKWDSRRGESTYGQITIDKALTSTREVYQGRAKPAAQPAANDSLELDPFRGTDDANADLLLKQHGADIRYCPPWERWLLWIGTHWQIDENLAIEKLASDVARMVYRKAADKEVDSERRKNMGKLANSLERQRSRLAMLAATRHKAVAHHSELNTRHFALNVTNGTIDLETGRLREHRRGDLLTHCTGIEYRKEAQAPTWLRFLSDVFDGDADLIQFVQRAIGYSLTGDVREQILLICYGSGSNGKSVFLNILQALLEGLALQAAPDLLMEVRGKHPTEQADLFGKRAVICMETAENMRMNEVLVKQLTGGDNIRARRMREDFWQFKPTHKLWMSTNHKPVIRGTDHAIWRRIRLIPFSVQFSSDGPHRKDPDMERKLMAELPGILAWAVQGCLDWQRNGLGIPDAVKAATDGYQADMDVLAAWLNECCVIDKNARAQAALLYKSYGEWCEANGERPEPQRRFAARLAERSFIRVRRTAGYFWDGIGLLKEGF